MAHTRSTAFALGLLTAAAVSALLAGRLEAAPPPDPAAAQVQALQAEVAALKARVTSLSARIETIDDSLQLANRTLELSGNARTDAILLQPGNVGAGSLLLERNDTTLRFQRLFLIGDDVSINASRAITLKAPTITLDGQKISVKESRDLTIKGSAIRRESTDDVSIGGSRIGDN